MGVIFDIMHDSYAGPCERFRKEPTINKKINDISEVIKLITEADKNLNSSRFKKIR